MLLKAAAFNGPVSVSIYSSDLLCESDPDSEQILATKQRQKYAVLQFNKVLVLRMDRIV